MNTIDILGTIGSILVLSAYYFLSKESGSERVFNYQLINISGATILAFYSYHCCAYASMASNIIWIGIALKTIKEQLKFKVSNITNRRKKGVVNEQSNHFISLSGN